MDKNASRYYGQIELLRFIFSILIVYYHLTPILFKSYPDMQLYNTLSEYNGASGKYLVICFFIISGFFFERSKCYKKQSSQLFFIQKFIRLWPVLSFSIFVNFHSTIDILNLFFINSGTGIVVKGSSNPASWYACNLFWLLIIFFLLFKVFTVQEKRNAILLILSIIGFCLISHQESELFSALVSKNVPFLTNGVAYGITGISIGVLLSQIEIFYIKRFKIHVIIAQIFLSIYFLYIVVLNKKRFEAAYYILIFIMLFYLLISYNDLKPFNHPVFYTAGACSYSIYMMQFPCFYYMRKLMSRGILKMASPLGNVILWVSICAFVGIVVHFVIERPAVSFLQRKLGTNKIYSV